MQLSVRLSLKRSSAAIRTTSAAVPPAIATLEFRIGSTVLPGTELAPLPAVLLLAEHRDLILTSDVEDLVLLAEAAYLHVDVASV